MSEEKSTMFWVGIVLVVLGLIFLPLFFQIVSYTNTVFITPEEFETQWDDAQEDGTMKDGETWLVYGWIYNRTEVTDEEKEWFGIDEDYFYFFKIDLFTNENKSGFLSSKDYMDSTDLLIEIKAEEIQGMEGDFLPVESNRVIWPVMRIPGLALLVIGAIPIIKGGGGKKAAKAKAGKENDGMFSPDEMASFSSTGSNASQGPPGAGGTPPVLAPPNLAPPAPGGPPGPGQPGSYQQPSQPSYPGAPPGPMGQSTQPPSLNLGGPGAPGPSMPPPSAAYPAPSAPPTPSYPPSGGQAAGPSYPPGTTGGSEMYRGGNFGVPMYVKCPACGEKMPAPPVRPARVQCSKCGTKGTIN